MYLEKLSLRHVRNFSHLEVAFSPQVNIFVGANAQGKTNLLEAIYFLALTRSHRTSNEKDLIQFHQKFAELAGRLHKSQVEVDLSLRLTNSGKQIWVNRIQQKKLAHYIGQMNVILFSPEDLALVKGAPALRRRFMDLEFCQLSPDYLYFSTLYKQVLQQKNTYLKQLAKHQTSDLLFLNVLSDQLAGAAAEISFRRLQFIDQLNHYAARAHAAISGSKETLTLSYQPSVAGIKSGDSVETIYHKLLAASVKNRAAELRQATTLIGPHRADLLLTLDGKAAHDYASQGQQRTIALSLDLAEIQLVHHLTKEYPILLLDDVMSELDHDRQARLLSYIHGKTQTFITTTDLTGISWEIVKAPKIYHIAAGQISNKEEMNG